MKQQFVQLPFLLCSVLIWNSAFAFHSKDSNIRNAEGRTAAWIALQQETSRSNTEVETELIRKQQSKPKSPRGKRRTAPLVDSSLLRFINSQKKARQIQRQQQELTGLWADPSADTSTSTRNNTVSNGASVSRANYDSRGIPSTSQSYLSSLFPKYKEATRVTALEAELAGMTPTEIDGDTAGDTSSSDNWLGQFNSNRVSMVLKSKLEPSAEYDELDSLIAKAGDRVQNQALARTARRHLRDFLKKRDREWSNLGASALNGEESIGSADTDQSGDENSFCGVVSVMTEYGLSVRDIAEIFIHSPGIAMMKPKGTGDMDSSKGEPLDETLHRVMVDLLCGTLQLRRYDARKVLRRTPGLLTMTGSRSAMEVVAIFEQISGSAKALARNHGSQLPVVLSRSPSAVFRLVAFLSSDAVRMPISSIGPLLRKPCCREVLDAVAPVPRLETTRNQEHLSGASLEDWILSNELAVDGHIDADPSVLAAVYGRGSQVRRDRINETYRKMSETAWTLRNEIGTADLGKVVAAYPSVLLLDAKEQILPTADYLMNELGVWKDDLPRVLQLYPVLLGKPLEDMQRVIDYLISLGVRRDSLPSMIRSFPALLNMNIECQMEPVVEFLTETVGIGNVGRVVTRLPPILGYSVENELKPKWEFLCLVSYDPLFEISRFPAYFSYPLDRVIRTRYAYLLKVKKISGNLPALDSILRYGDHDFATKVARDQDSGERFLRFVQRNSSKKGPRPKRRNQQQPKQTPPNTQDPLQQQRQ